MHAKQQRKKKRNFADARGAFKPSQTFKMEIITKSCILFVTLWVFKMRLNAVIPPAVLSNYRR